LSRLVFFLIVFSSSLHINAQTNVIRANVFTPNGDNVNDEIDFSALNLTEQTVTVYNLWGEKVFASDQYHIKWDGKNEKGVDCSAGTYFYTVTFREFINKTANEKGFIQLLR
jgi:gliding motility-associated-like protein